MWLQCTTVTMLGRTASMRPAENPETFPKGSDPDKPEVEAQRREPLFPIHHRRRNHFISVIFVTILNSAMAPDTDSHGEFPSKESGLTAMCDPSFLRLASQTVLGLCILNI